MTILNKRGDKRRTLRAGSRRPRQNKLIWVEGPESRRLEARTLLTLSVTSFPIPVVGIVQPDGITEGPDGDLWFTETAADKIGRVTTAGVVTHFPLPPIPIPVGTQTNPGSPPGPVAITVGPDGALWFVGVPGAVGRINTAGVVTEFPVPDVPPPAGSPAGTASTPPTLTAITAGPDGALWFTGVPGEVGRITTTGAVTEFAVPDVPPPAGSPAGTAGTPAAPTGITMGPDGALWFAGVPGEVGRMTTAGALTEFAVPEIPPPAGSPAGTAGTVVTPGGLTTGPDGALWFTANPAPGNSLVGRITTTGAVTEYATPNFNIGSAIVTGPDGNLWFIGGVLSPNDIGQLTPAGVFTSFTVTGNFNGIAGLTAGPNGKLWFTEEEDGVTASQRPAVGEISPAGVTTVYPIPQGMTLDPTRGLAVDPTAIAAGPDGALWFTDDAGIGRITTEGTLQTFPLTTPGAMPRNITSGPDGTLWFTQEVTAANGYSEIWSIGRITTAGAINLFPLPANVSLAGGITEARDGDLWFTETRAIGRITPSGKITTYAVATRKKSALTLGAITTTPDGQVWFSGGFQNGSASTVVVGQVTGTGHVKVFDLPATGLPALNSYDNSNPYNLISGPDGNLWFADQMKVAKGMGIARISTGGKLDRMVPAGIDQDLTLGPNGQVWFLSFGGVTTAPSLSVATRSGIVVINDLPALTIDLPALTISNSATGGAAAGVSGTTAGPDGNLWLTDGVSSIVRVSGLETPTGALDYRHRPMRAPDYSRYYYWSPWTNVSSSAQPTFAGVAKPGAEVTLWAQMQGQNQPTAIGKVKANRSDGSWTLKSHVRLSDGNYGVTASQTGDAVPPSVLYTLDGDPSSVYAGPLVIDTSTAKTQAHGHAAS